MLIFSSDILIFWLNGICNGIFKKCLAKGWQTPVPEEVGFKDGLDRKVEFHY